MNAHDPTAPNRGERERLGASWTAVTVVIGIMAAAIALGGMVLSFRAVSTEMVPAFGAQWAWLVPIVVDLTVFVFSGVDLVLARRGIPHPLARVTVYGATAGTVWLNYQSGAGAAGRVAHILMPSVWVMFIELMRHVVRHEAHLVGTSLREPIPATRWLLSPWPTLKLWRRMVLWRVNSYTVALGHERERLRRGAGLREQYGPLWRLRVSPLVRLELNLGPAAPGANGSDANSANQGDEPAARTGSARTEPATRTGEPRPKRHTEPAANRTARTGAANTNPRPNATGPGDQLRARRLQIIREMATAGSGRVPLAAIQTRFGCAKSTASEMRKEALAAPTSEPEPEPERGASIA